MIHEKLLIAEEYRALNQLEKIALPVDSYISGLYRSGITHVGYGEDHGSTYLHRSVNSLIPVLKASGVEVICLELNYQMQEFIDLFQTTGDDAYLNKVIDEEKEHLKKGLPVEGRIETPDYFDIIRNATTNGIRVIATDDVWLKRISERDRLMAEKTPADKKVFSYAGQIHLSGKYVEFGGVPKFLMEKGTDMYVIRNIYRSHGSNHDLKRHALSRRFLETVKISPLLCKMGTFAFDIKFNEEAFKIISDLFPGKNPGYFGDGFIYNND